MLEVSTRTVTFLFTDIEGSTVRWEQHPEEMRLALARHDELMRACMESEGGRIFKTVGDAFYVVFASAGAALSAAIAAQRALFAETWEPHIGSLRVRMAIHTGEAEHRGQDYFGQPLNRVARILSCGHGGQVLLSHTTMGLVRDVLPSGISLQDLGEHRLKDIQQPEQIFQLIIDGLPGEFPSLKTLDRHPNNLPTQLTPFIGRKKDLEAIESLFQRNDVRLVTLVGPGGIGKTRLGLQVAADLADTFSEGIYFVDVAAVEHPDEVISALAQVLNTSTAHIQPTIEHVKTHLRGKILLFIDNFEQVIDASPLIYELLVACKSLKVLVTSRSVLHLSGEYEYQIPPLTVPNYKRLPDLAELMQYETITLFIQYAKAARPDFQLNESNAAAIAEICNKLDGLPLALELAAARVNLLPPQAMVKRLGRRLQVLTGGKRNRAARQQTLRNAIAWSYNLLDSDEKALFAQLAVFQGSCTLEAIESVCQLPRTWEGDVFELLQSLTDKSLLRLEEQQYGEPRFEMLHTIREYALEQLSEDALSTARSRHAEYYQKLVSHSGPPPVGVAQRNWMAHLEAEYENIREALNWYTEHGQSEAGLRLAEALWPFWWLRGLVREARKWFEKLLTREHESRIDPRVKVKALEKASTLISSQGDYAYAASLAEEALLISQSLDDKELIIRASVALAGVAIHQREYQRAGHLLEESLKLREATGDIRGTASLLNNLGNVARQQEQLDRSSMLHEKSLHLFRSVGDEIAIAAVSNNLAEVEWQRGYQEQAEILYQESLKLCQKLGYTWGIASSLAGLGKAASYHGEYEQALRNYKESLQLFQEMDDYASITACLEGLGEVIYKQNRPELASRLLVQADVVGYQMGPGMSEIDRASEVLIEKLRTVLGEKTFDTLWTARHMQILEQVITEMLK